MEWLNNLAQNSETPVIAAFALGLLTAVSPCPLATNITATAYIAKSIESKKQVILSGFLYTLGRLTSYTAIGALIYFGFSKFQVAKLFQGNGEKFLGPLMILIGLVMLDVIITIGVRVQSGHTIGTGAGGANSPFSMRAQSEGAFFSSGSMPLHSRSCAMVRRWPRL